MVVVSNGSESKNIGWRLDYFVVSERMKDKITEAKINSEVMESDHGPVELHINFKKKYPLTLGGYFLFILLKFFKSFLK